MTIGKQRLAYVICADKPIRYEKGRSRIVYIGTTKTGINRVAQSAAWRADKILTTHGVTTFQVRLVTCTPRQKVKSWHVLERALLLTFRDLFGQVPLCNTHGKKIRWIDEGALFSKQRLITVVEDLS